MTRYCFPLLPANILSFNLSLKLHMNIVQKLSSTALPSLFIITCKFSSSFSKLVLNALFFVNFFSRYLFVHILFTVEERSPSLYFPVYNVQCFLQLYEFSVLGLKSKSPLINKALYKF